MIAVGVTAQVVVQAVGGVTTGVVVLVAVRVEVGVAALVVVQGGTGGTVARVGVQFVGVLVGFAMTVSMSSAASLSSQSIDSKSSSKFFLYFCILNN